MRLWDAKNEVELTSTGKTVSAKEKKERERESERKKKQRTNLPFFSLTETMQRNLKISSKRSISKIGTQSSF